MAPRADKEYNDSWAGRRMTACFCGCGEYEKDSYGFKIACVKCGHGPQNHDDGFRASARTNENRSQKRDADFG